MDTSPLDIAKFNLSAFKTMKDVEKMMLEAHANYLFRMTEVAEKQIKVEKDKLALRQLKRAFKRLNSAIKKQTRKVVTLEREIQRRGQKVKDVAKLMLGETLNPTQVSTAWNGYHYIVTKSDATAIFEMGKIKATTEHRQAVHFSKNRFPDAELETPTAAEARTALTLMAWLKRRSYVPRIGSPPQHLLAAVLDVARESAENQTEDLETELADSEEQLQKLRDKHWKKVAASEIEDASKSGSKR